MSLHKSLKQKNTLSRRRNVLTRAERVDRLREDERWEETSSVFGLPKVKSRVVTAPSRARRPEETETVEEGEEAESVEQ